MSSIGRPDQTTWTWAELTDWMGVLTGIGRAPIDDGAWQLCAAGCSVPCGPSMGRGCDGRLSVSIVFCGDGQDRVGVQQRLGVGQRAPSSTMKATPGSTMVCRAHVAATPV